LKARSYASEGRRWVVDMDLEKFFDRVNHDILLERVSRKVGDKRVLLLIRRFLQAGLMKDGLTTQRTEGTPQGGPLSPLLSNIMLDDLDKELERRGHRFCRYADDCDIYVKSKAAGERVLESIGLYLSKRLKLRLNREKSKVERPWKSKFLGYSMTMERATPRLKVSPESERRLRAALKEKFRQGRGRAIQRVIEEINPKLSGWGSYFKLSEVKRAFEELDSWIRRRLRVLLWKQWKKPKAIKRNLAGRGLSVERSCKSAWNGRGSWWNSGASHMNEAFPKSYFDSLGLVSLYDITLRNA
jgi:RNA-directed DNA polymerase